MKNIILMILAVILSIAVNAQCNSKRSAVPLISVLYGDAITLEAGLGKGVHIISGSLSYGKEIKGGGISIQHRLFNNQNLYAGGITNLSFNNEGNMGINFGVKGTAFIIGRVGITMNILYNLYDNKVRFNTGLTILFN